VGGRPDDISRPRLGQVASGGIDVAAPSHHLICRLALAHPGLPLRSGYAFASAALISVWARLMLRPVVWACGRDALEKISDGREARVAGSLVVERAAMDKIQLWPW